MCVGVRYDGGHVSRSTGVIFCCRMFSYLATLSHFPRLHRRMSQESMVCNDVTWILILKDFILLDVPACRGVLMF